MLRSGARAGGRCAAAGIFGREGSGPDAPGGPECRKDRRRVRKGAPPPRTGAGPGHRGGAYRPGRPSPPALDNRTGRKLYIDGLRSPPTMTAQHNNGPNILERILEHVELIEQHVEDIAANLDECLDAARYGAAWRPYDNGY
jgi:hypothetical protein